MINHYLNSFKLGDESLLAFYLCDFQSVTLRRCVTNKPPAMRVRIEGYTKKTPIAIQ